MAKFNLKQDEIQNMMAYLNDVKDRCNGHYSTFKMSDLFQKHHVPLNTSKICQMMGLISKYRGNSYRWNVNHHSSQITPRLAVLVWEKSLDRTHEQCKNAQRKNKQIETEEIQFDIYEVNANLKNRVSELQDQLADKAVIQENKRLLEQIKQLETQLSNLS